MGGRSRSEPQTGGLPTWPKHSIDNHNPQMGSQYPECHDPVTLRPPLMRGPKGRCGPGRMDRNAPLLEADTGHADRHESSASQRQERPTERDRLCSAISVVQ